MRKLVSTDGASRGENMSRWLDEARAAYCTLDFSTPSGADLRGSIESSTLGRLTLSQVHCNADVIRHLPARGIDEDDHFVALLMLKGEAEITQQRRSSVLEPGDMVVHSCHEPYRLTFGHASHSLYGVRIPRDRLVRCVADPYDMTARVVSRSRLPAQVLKFTLERLHRDSEAHHGPSETALADMLIDTVVAGLQSLEPSIGAEAKGVAAYHVARIYEHLERHLADPGLSITTVAAAVGLSVDHVGRLFRKQPRPLTDWIWQARLEACRRDLVDPRRAAHSISEIGYSWGFNDAAHFSRRFRQFYGASPRDFRRQRGVIDRPSRVAS